MQILEKYQDRPDAQAVVRELEAYTGGPRRNARRAASPSSSSSSYHSSQASPPVSPVGQVRYTAPDPSLPAPDVAPDIVPPSALTPSHRSLLNLEATAGPSQQPIYGATPALGLVPGSRTHSLAGEPRRKESIHSLRPHRHPASALGFVTEQPRASGSRPLTPQVQATPDLFSPYLQPTPVYGRRGSASTFSHAPLTIPQNLQQIQTSLTALHERMSTLERTQAMLLRRAETPRGWFWSTSEADELDDLEDEVDRARWRTTAMKVKRRKRGLTIRVVWILLTAVRRAMMDVGVGMLVALIGVIVLGGGWRRARITLTGLLSKARRFVTQA